MGDKITIYIQTVYDKYIDRFRFVYKSFSIYIQIETHLYINRRPKKALSEAEIKEAPARFVAEPCGCLMPLEEYKRSYSYLFVIGIYAVCPNIEMAWQVMGAKGSAGKIGGINVFGAHVLLQSIIHVVLFKQSALLAAASNFRQRASSGDKCKKIWFIRHSA